MTDQRLRRLEREVAASPSRESEAALLRERLRAGTLSPERLELAAYCGHEGARGALGIAPWVGRVHFEDPPGFTAADGTRYEFSSPDVALAPAYALGPWVRGLSRWGPAVQVRAAMAAARLVLARRSAGLDLWPDSPGFLWGQANRAVEAAERWLVDPNEGNRIDAARAFLAARPVDAGIQFRWLPMVPTRYQAGTHPTPEGGGWGEEPPYPGPSLWHPGEIMAAAELAGEVPVRAAIQSALITWALGSP